MNTWCCLFVTILVQFTSAQVKQYGVPASSVGYANIARGLPNGLAIARNFLKGLPITDQLVRTVPMGANNIANTNLFNAQGIATNYKPYLVNVNKVVTKLPNNINNIVESKVVNPVITKNEIRNTAMAETNNNVNTNFMANVGTSAILANNIVKPELKSFTENSNTGNKISYSIGYGPNMAASNFGNNGIPVSVSRGSPTNQPLGIKVMADKLEVAGTVSVSGRMPIYGTVTLNGNVPTDGKASVNYGCGSPAA